MTVYCRHRQPWLMWLALFGVACVVIKYAWPVLVVGFAWWLIYATLKRHRHQRDHAPDWLDERCSLCRNQRERELAQMRAEEYADRELAEYRRLRAQRLR